MLGVAALAFALGVLLTHGIEALGGSVAFVIAASILNTQPGVHTLSVLPPVHYWQGWTVLFEPAGHAHLGAGVLDQLATIAAATALAVLVLLRRDPAA